MSKVITLLGSTGSIGTQSLDVCRMHGYEVFGLSANSSVDKLLAQIAEFHPKYVAVTDPAAFEKLSAALAGQANAPKLLKGADGLRELATMDGAGTVLNAVVGIAGLDASLAAIESGHDLALANKESLVTGGHLVTDAVRKNGVHLLPVDSEHSAIFQCLQDQHSAKTLEKILLTASGGPFYGMTTEELRGKTKADALKHPNWNMGAKITIDSATLMNKGPELNQAACPECGAPLQNDEVWLKRGNTGYFTRATCPCCGHYYLRFKLSRRDGLHWSFARCIDPATPESDARWDKQKAALLERMKKKAER